MEISVDLTLAAAVWLQFTAYRGFIPAKWLSIDGQLACWIGVFLTALGTMVLIAGPNGAFVLSLPHDSAGYIHLFLQALVTSATAIIIDGGAAYSGAKDTVRKIVTVGGRINEVGQAAIPVAQTVLPATTEIQSALKTIETFLTTASQARESLGILLEPSSIPAPK